MSEKMASQDTAQGSLPETPRVPLTEWLRNTIDWLEANPDQPNRQLFLQALVELIARRTNESEELRHIVHKLEDCLEGESLSLSARRKLEALRDNVRSTMRRA